MSKLETANNFSSYCVFNILKVDSSDSGIYSGRCKRVIRVSPENRNIRVSQIFKLLCSKGLKNFCGINFTKYIVLVSGTIVYDKLNLSTQKYFCKNVNHLNLFCTLFLQNIHRKKLKLSNYTGMVTN